MSNTGRSECQFVHATDPDIGVCYSGFWRLSETLQWMLDTAFHWMLTGEIDGYSGNLF